MLFLGKKNALKMKVDAAACLCEVNQTDCPVIQLPENQPFVKLACSSLYGACWFYHMNVVLLNSPQTGCVLHRVVCSYLSITGIRLTNCKCLQEVKAFEERWPFFPRYSLKHLD